MIVRDEEVRHGTVQQKKVLGGGMGVLGIRKSKCKNFAGCV
jgi:hypothetical protein